MDKEYKEDVLIRKHKLSGQEGNIQSIINSKNIVRQYLNPALIITKDKKASSYNFSYYVKKDER